MELKNKESYIEQLLSHKQPEDYGTYEDVLDLMAYVSFSELVTSSVIEELGVDPTPIEMFMFSAIGASSLKHTCEIYSIDPKAKVKIYDGMKTIVEDMKDAFARLTLKLSIKDNSEISKIMLKKINKSV